MSSSKIINTQVRNINLTLAGHNRSLELCARMNYETENLDFIDSATLGTVYYDLGACEGRFSIYAALKGLHVYCFEPEKENYNVLCENVALNKLEDQIKSFQIGVGAANGTTSMLIGQPWAGGHQKVVKTSDIRQDVAQFDFKDEQTITIARLDDFIATHQLPFPDLLKIDIDGSEMAFLAGAHNTLSDKRLQKIMFELDKSDINFNEIIIKLNECGFTLQSEFLVPNEPNLFNIIFIRQ